MIITTTPEIAGKTIIEYKGIVFAEEVRVADKVNWTAKSQIEMTETMIYEANNKAMQKLVHRADEIGANAVVGISFFTTQRTVNAFGTAVVVE